MAFFCRFEHTDAGKTAYLLSSCAPCHGVDAKGSGVFSVELKLKEPPPDLTGLAKRDGGVLPARAVNEIIDCAPRRPWRSRNADLGP